MNNGDYTVDENRLRSDNTAPTQNFDTGSMSSSKMNNAKMKMKQKEDKTKVKSKDEK